jgi:hypothetical protein
VKRLLVSGIAIASLMAGGCSTRPREFAAALNPPPADAAAFEIDLATCTQLVRQGNRRDFLAAAAATGGGAVAGYAAGMGSVAAGLTPVGLGMSTTAGVALLTLMPLVGIGAAVGISRAIRADKEKDMKEAMTDCLVEHGHTGVEWTLQKKRREGAS